MNTNECPKCSKSKDVRAQQCKACRKKEQQSTKDQTEANRYDQCLCGQRKNRRSLRCKDCANAAKRGAKCIGNGQYRCPHCGGPISAKSDRCMKCYHMLLRSVVLPDGRRTCTRCQQVLQPDEFWNSTYTFDKKRSICRKCTGEAHRKQHIRRRCQRMGLSLEEANKIADLEVINCEICGVILGKSFHIDHCHKTNKFRGLLCSNCNIGIGLFGDDPNRLKAAVAYLIRFN